MTGRVSDDWSSLVASREYLSAGRPLLARIEAAGGEAAFPKRHRCTDKEITFLCKKLRGGRSSYTDQGALSRVLRRVAAPLSRRHPLASRLVAGSMATLLSTDAERRSALSCCVAEPKLAVAASEEWGTEERLLRFFLPALDRSVSTGAISLGHRGGLTAQIIMLLWAFDSACRKQGLQAGQRVKMRAVLIELLPDAADDEEMNACIPDGLEEAHVACCQFVGLVQRPRPEAIAHLAERHAGAALREGQRLLVPVLMPSSLLVVQAKDRPSQGSSKPRIDAGEPGASSGAACGELLPSHWLQDDVFPPNSLGEYDRRCVRVLMQPGSRVAAWACGPIRGEGARRAAPLRLFGVASRCLAGRVKAALRALVEGRAGLEAVSRDSLRRAGRGGVPLPDSMGDIRRAWPFVCRACQGVPAAGREGLCGGRQVPVSGDGRALLEGRRQSSASK